MPAAATTLARFMDSAAAARSAGAWEDALSHYESSLRRVPKEGDARSAAEILRGIGNVHYARGDFEDASEVYDTSLIIAEASGLPEQTASALNCLAVVEQYAGAVGSAEALYVRASKIAEEMGDRRRVAMIEQNLGTLANVRGEVDLALKRYEAAFEAYQGLGDELGAARVLNNMGMAYVDIRAWSSAERCFDTAFLKADAAQDADTLGAIEINRSELYLRRREPDRAREACDRAFELFGRLGSKTGLAEASKFYGAIYRETGKLHLAQTHLTLALELARLCQDRLLQAEVEREQAMVHLEAGRDRDSLEALNRAHLLFAEFHATREILDIEQRLNRLEEVYLEAALRWAETVESKDRYTEGHCRRVAHHACRLAEAYGISGRELAWFRMGALLHDVGKSDVPGEVLNKPGVLTSSEWELMRSHTERGDRIVSDLHFPWDVRPIVRSHHERWDGSGYPDGLAGDAIPLVARIVGIADAYDALTTERSYRPALPAAEALRVMEEEAGRVLDPTLFALFRKLMEREPSGPVSLTGSASNGV